MSSRPRAARTARLLAATTLPLALALSACGGDDADPTGGSGTEATPSTDAPTSQPPTAPAETPAPTDGQAGGDVPQPGGSPAETATALLGAAQAALDIVEGTVVTVEAQRTGWEVSIVDGRGAETEVDTDLAGTAVIGAPRTDVDDAEDRDEALREVNNASIGFEAALDAARGEVTDLPVDSIDLDSDDGRVTWNVQFGDDDANEVTVIVDAASGEVVGTELDD